MNIDYIYKHLENKSNPTEDDTPYLKVLADKYPYFQANLFMYLKSVSLYENGHFEDELSRLALFVKDRRALFYYIFDEEYGVFTDRQKGAKSPDDKTATLLSAFLNTLDMDEDDSPMIDLNLDFQLPESALATQDYLSYLNAIKHDDGEAKETPPLKGQEIIDAFILKSEKGNLNFNIERDITERESLSDNDIANEPSQENDAELSEDNVFFTETLAKIYIKQKKYQKAYKIIKHLSLNYPEKNTYFADQLSFLEKLIINSKHNK